MKYYKLILNTEFIGIGTSLDLRCFQPKHRVLLACDESQAQYIQYKEKLYCDQWMLADGEKVFSGIPVSVIEIDEKEYDTLSHAVETGEEILIEEEHPENDNPAPTDIPTEVTLEYAKNMKIAEMSILCNRTIESGCDVMLSDGITHHFSLSTQDQLNLITLSSMVANGEQSIPYHADGELCRFYSADDISAVVSSATAYKTYHVSYFNALKAYICSLTDIDSIGQIAYGIEIPEAYQSDVLKSLLSTGMEV